MSKILALFILFVVCVLPASAFAQATPTTGVYFNNVPGYTTGTTPLTRPANTFPYAANETVCTATSVTVCPPVAISIANVFAGQGLINRFSMLKSGSATTNATFIWWLYSAAPGTATPNQYDATSYTGPRAADMPNYIGNATCSTGIVTSDAATQVWYECTLSNPNTAGVLDFKALAGGTTINAILSVTAAYTPASGETFTPYVSGFY
jgi:hypothetical protein